MPHEHIIKKILTTSKVLTEEQVAAAVRSATEKHVKLEEELVTSGVISEQLLYETLASGFKIPFVDLTSRNIRRDIFTLLPEPIMAAHNVAAFVKSDGQLKVAMVDKDDLQILDFIEKH